MAHRPALDPQPGRELDGQQDAQREIERDHPGLLPAERRQQENADGGDVEGDETVTKPSRLRAVAEIEIPELLSQ